MKLKGIEDYGVKVVFDRDICIVFWCIIVVIFLILFK